MKEDEKVVVGPNEERWGTWEELILGGAVLRHGTKDWNVVALELQTRTLYPYWFTPEVCKAKYEDLRKRYYGCSSWFEELRKRRVAELKRELKKSDDTIESLELKIKRLKSETQRSKEVEKVESISLEPEPSSAGPIVDDKPVGLTVKKRRGKRKRKDCEEGSIGESDNICSRIKETSTSECNNQTTSYGTVNHNRSLYRPRDDDVKRIFDSIAQNEFASVFRHRLDGQKRARYKKLIKRHLDFGLIRSKIGDGSIKTTKELFRDLLLLANNALVFYSKRTREYKSAFILKDVAMKAYKQHCDTYKSEFVSLSPLYNPPGKPRSVRRRPCKDKVPEKVDPPENAGGDSDIPVVSTTKGFKRPANVKRGLPEITRPKAQPMKEKKKKAQKV